MSGFNISSMNLNVEGTCDQSSCISGVELSYCTGHIGAVTLPWIGLARHIKAPQYCKTLPSLPYHVDASQLS